MGSSLTLADDEEGSTSRAAQLAAYWRDRLAGIPDQLALPMDRSRPLSLGSANGSVRRLLNADLRDKLVELAREHDASLSTLAHAAVAALLSSLGAGHDIVLGMPGSKDGEPIGAGEPAANRIPFRLNTSGNPTFRDLLIKARAAALEAYAHQDIAFEQLVDLMDPVRSQSYHPLFQVELRVEAAEHDDSGLGGSGTGRQPTALSIPPCDIIFILRNIQAPEEPNESVAIEIVFLHDLFDEGTIDRLADRLIQILMQVTADEDVPLADLKIVTSSEDALLARWSKRQCPIAPRRFVELFEHQVDQAPDATAVIFEEDCISYAELDRRANQVAHLLAELGVGPDTIVGICTRRSPEMLVAMLGTIKAGAAYLPIDSNLPADRISYILEDSMASVILTVSSLRDGLPTSWAVVVELDHNTDLSGMPVARLCGPGDVADLLYVIYTSGSTGQPKGVGVTNAGVASLIATQKERLGAGAGVRVLQFAPFSFDAAFWECCMALLSGGTLVLADPASILPGEALAGILKRYAITHLTLPPSALNLLPEGSFDEGRRLIVAGEACPPALVNRWNGVLVNAYGPTEATVCASLTENLTPSPAVPIGNPVDNTELYVLDWTLRPVPPGISGDLYIAGPSLARGYVSRPALTAERFVANPFGSNGSRMYRTGDLARWRQDGQLEFLGRSDGQIKLRGFRIELGEIEAELLKLSGVSQASALIREDLPGHQQLVAYASPQVGVTLSGEDLRRALRKRLPDYMIPAAVVCLPAMPLTSNGKIDKKNLPALKFESNENEKATTEEEKILYEVFTDVLGVENFCVTDSFFDLGGDSLLLLKLKAKAEKRGMSFDLATLYDHQSVRALASVAECVKAPGSESTQPFHALNGLGKGDFPLGAVDAYPLSALQLGMLFHSGFQSDSTLYHNVFSVSLNMTFDKSIMEATINSLISRHEILRTSFDLHNYFEPLQIVYDAAPATLHIYDLSALPPEGQESEFAKHARHQAELQFNTTIAPLMNMYVHILGQLSFRISIRVHHSIMDGWSDAIFFTELLTQYKARLSGTWVEPPALSTRYRDYIELEQAAIQFEDSLGFWRSTLKDATPTKPLRQHRSDRASEPHGLQTSRDFLIPSQAIAGLNELARRCGAPLKSVLLAVHISALGELGECRDVMTALVTNGRPETTDGEKMVGLFLNSVPFRLRLEEESWIDLIGRVMRTERDLLPHRRYPLALIQRNTGIKCVPYVVFNYTNFHAFDALGDLRSDVSAMGGIEGDASFCVQVGFELQGSSLTGSISAHRTSYGDADLDRFVEVYHRRIEAILANPGLSIFYPGKPDKRLSLAQVHSPANLEIEHFPLGELFEHQAAKSGHADALVWDGGHSASYDFLNRLANCMAWRLIARGVGPGDIVAIALPRSVEMIAAVLAVTKSGAAYLPIDMTYPAERIGKMLADAAPVYILSSPEQKDLFSPEMTIEVVFEELCNARNVAPNPTNADRVRPLHLTDLAYVIYTSGTTGQPKGVGVTHQGISSLAHALRENGEIDSNARVLQFSSPGFDAFLLELLLAFTSGGSLVLLRTTLMAGDDFIAMLDATEITHALLPPALLTVLPSAALPKLTTLFVGGDRCSPDIVTRWGRVRRLCNAYGPTEVTVCATISSDLSVNAEPAIGGPIANTSVYVLDAALARVGPQEVGEIYVAGLGLARGYLGQAGLTAARFVANPFGEPGSRMYRTGDKARWRDDGQLEFLGRVDRQIKLRGFRIELDEVDASIRASGDVLDAVTILDTAQAGSASLVSYIIPRDPGHYDTERLRQALAASVPSYMIPAHIVPMVEFPTNAHGKLDISALPRPQHKLVKRQRAASADEEIVAEAFARVLKLTDVALDQNFFDAGGDSLLAVQLVSWLRARLSPDLPISALYRAPTPSALAELCRSDLRSKFRTSLIPLRAPGMEGTIFCLPPAGNLPWCYSNLVKHIDLGYAVFGIQLSGGDSAASSMSDRISDVLAAILQANLTRPYTLLGWSMGGLLAHGLATALHAEGEKIHMLGIIDAYPPDALVKQFHDSNDEPAELESFLRRALAAVGGPTDMELDLNLSPQQLTDKLVAGRALASADQPALLEMMRGFESARRVSETFQPKSFHGDMLFFQSASAVEAGLSPAAWRPYVSGDINSHQLDCDHDAMLDSDCLPKLSAEINAALSAVARPEVFRNTDDIRSRRPSAATHRHNEVAVPNEPLQ